MRQHTAIPFVVLVLLVVSSSLHAVSPYQPVHPDPALEPWRWTVYPELRGFGLHCLAEDHEGNMWFGGRGGVRMYDGMNWTSFTEENGLGIDQVQALYVARDRTVYAGAARGIARFRDGQGQRLFPLDGSFSLYCRDLLEDSAGTLWATSTKGLLRLSGDEVTFYTSSDLADALPFRFPHIAFEELPAGVQTPRTYKDGIGLWWWRLPGDQRVICRVYAGSQAERAGLKPGDRILSVDGDPEGSLAGPAGTTLRLAVEREGHPEPIEVQLTVEEKREWS